MDVIKLKFLSPITTGERRGKWSNGSFIGGHSKGRLPRRKKKHFLLGITQITTPPLHPIWAFFQFSFLLKKVSKLIWAGPPPCTNFGQLFTLKKSVKIKLGNAKKIRCFLGSLPHDGAPHFCQTAFLLQRKCVDVAELTPFAQESTII